jgi:hypothetical protein
LTRSSGELLTEEACISDFRVQYCLERKKKMTDHTKRKQKEDRYLNILRRTIIVTAQIALILAVLLLLIGGGLFAYAWVKSTHKYNIQAAKPSLLQATDPARWLHDSGLYSEAALRPDNYVMSSQITTEANLPEAYLQVRQSVVAPINLSYKDPNQIRSTWTGLVEQALQPVEAADVWEQSDLDSRREARILLGNVLIAYWKSLGDIVREHNASFDKPITGDSDQVSANVRQLNDGTFFVEAAQKVLKASVADHNAAHSEALLLTAGATQTLLGAVSAFAYFLFVMLIFVLVKVEIDLREIRDALRQNAPSSSVQP